MDALFMIEFEQELLDEINQGKETTMAYAEKMEVDRAPTPFERLSNAVDRLAKAESGVAEMTAKLVGESVKGNGAKSASAPLTGPGMFGGIEEMANRIDDLVSDIANHVLRVGQRI